MASKKLAFPETVRVGHRDIVIMLAGFEELGMDTYGDYRPSLQCIRVSKLLPPQTQAEVLLHEILHAVFPSEANWLHHRDMEEAVVSGISPPLTQVMADNPDVFAWIVGAVNGEV